MNRCIQNIFLDYGALVSNYAPILHRNKHYLQMDRSEIQYDTRHLGVPLSLIKLISKHMVCSMQTVQVSCIKISTFYEQTQPNFHLSLFTYEYHRMRLKWFLSLWCIRRKSCTYLAPKQTLSLNGPKRDSI